MCVIKVSNFCIRILLFKRRKEYLIKIRGLIARYPILERYLRLIKWRILKSIHRILICIKSKIVRFPGDPYQVYWVSSHIFKYTINMWWDVPKPQLVTGMIKGGNWDKNIFPVKDLLPIRSVRDRFINGKSWQETEYYHSFLERISKGDLPYGCHNKQDIDKHCSYIDELFGEIDNNGYKLQTELRGTKFGDSNRVEHEITVNIDRDGRYLFCDGRRRLAIVYALNIEKIPVKVCIRHAKWEAFRQEILDFAKKTYGNKIYQPLTHPDLQIVQSVHDESRFKIIRNNLSLDKGTLLDIGANWGYFCHRFEELGFKCYAIESSPKQLYFLKKLRKAQDRKFQIIGKSIFEYQDMPHFDVILALNIFHHFLKTSQLYENFLCLLKGLDMDILFFESHKTSEQQMKQSYRNFEPDEFVKFIIQYTKLNQSKFIGYASDGRPIYKLWKSTDG